MNRSEERLWRIRLLTGVWSKKDYSRYLKTDHWKAKKEEAAAAWTEILKGRLRCLLCDKTKIDWHHTPEGYSHLFTENVVQHLRPLCTHDHKTYEKGRKKWHNRA